MVNKVSPPSSKTITPVLSNNDESMEIYNKRKVQRQKMHTLEKDEYSDFERKSRSSVNRIRSPNKPSWAKDRKSSGKKT